MNDLFAAIDLGSNSFHLLLARRTDDGFETVERLKEKVQLLAGFDGVRLHPGAVSRGADCLARFAQRLAGVPRSNIQVAGTHALRVAGGGEFPALVTRVIGVPLEVVSGEDEARLVYLGVSHHVPSNAPRMRLVVDVGGGSTELAWGDGASAEPARVASFELGCVALRDRYFGNGHRQAEAFIRARAEARTLLRRLQRPERAEIIGTSGTVESIQAVLAANGWGSATITKEGLTQLIDTIVSGRWLIDAGLPGLVPERLDIFPSGLAIVDALFEVLGLRTMRFVDASLQDGLLYRLLPAPTADRRPDTVAGLKRRFRVDAAQAARVRGSALALFDATAGWWTQPGRWRDLLGWAADLHELGRAVAPEHYHRHGAYLLQNSDLRAFSQAERDQLALLLRGHRRSFPGLALRGLDDDVRAELVRLLALLRIAVILNRSHTDTDVPAVAASAAAETLRLTLPDGWLAAHPLSAKELTVEAAQLADAGIRLEVGDWGRR
ncbi:MAG: Ppx/GppA phosphatase family protein [Pseudomonadales bacterium]